MVKILDNITLVLGVWLMSGKLTINDSVGSGATGYAAVKGSFQEIKILDKGFDFIYYTTYQIDECSVPTRSGYLF